MNARFASCTPFSQRPLAALLLTALLLTALPPAPATAQTPTPAAQFRVSECVVAIIDQVDVPAREPGVLTRLAVREGAVVASGDELGRIDDLDSQTRLKAAQKDLEMARQQADNEASVKAAIAMEEVSKAEYEKTKTIDDQLDDAVSFFELERLRLTWVRAGYQAVVAGIEKHIAELQLDVKAAQLEGVQLEINRRVITAPTSGFIAQRYRNVGEWVNAGDPVYRLVHMDRLRIEGMIHSSEVSPNEIEGRPVTIIVDLERGRKVKLEGKVTMASSVVEAGGLFLVFAEFDNPRAGNYWPVLPGLDAELIIHLDKPITPLGDR